MCTFIIIFIPYFDYCLSISIYFSKQALQKLSNCYYLCLLKLFKFDFKDWDCCKVNDFLKNYNLFAFQHRCFFRLSLFSFKIVNNDMSPPHLKEQIQKVCQKAGSYYLRNNNDAIVKMTKTKFGERTFSNFFSRLINCCFGNYFFSGVWCGIFKIKTFFVIKFEHYYYKIFN